MIQAEIATRHASLAASAHSLAMTRTGIAARYALFVAAAHLVAMRKKSGAAGRIEFVMCGRDETPAAVKPLGSNSFVSTVTVPALLVATGIRSLLNKEISHFLQKKRRRSNLMKRLPCYDGGRYWD